MPDTNSDLAVLTVQVRALSGDLDRRFELTDKQFDRLSTRLQESNLQVEQFSSRLQESNVRIEQLSVRIEQLSGRLDALAKSAVKVTPNFVGLTVTEAKALSQQTGIHRFEEDTQEHPKMLEALERGVTGHEHSEDEIVINFQNPLPGAALGPMSLGQKPFVDVGMTHVITVGYNTAPGVPL